MLGLLGHKRMPPALCNSAHVSHGEVNAQLQKHVADDRGGEALTCEMNDERVALLSSRHTFGHLWAVQDWREECAGTSNLR